MELVVVVGIEDVVLAIVLVVDGDLDRPQPFDEHVAGVDAVGLAAVGIAAPLDEDRREVLVGLPVARVDQLLNAGAVGARLRAEDAIAGARLDLVERRVRRARELGQVVLARIVLLRPARRATTTSSTARSTSAMRCGNASRKKPLMRSVTSMRGRPSRSSGIDRQILNAARLRIPDRLHAEQRQHLGDVVALGSHLRRAPGADADHLRVAALFREMPGEHLVRELLADPPRRLRRHRPRIDGIEVPAGRQDVRHPARRRARRPGRHVAPGERVEHVIDFVGHLLQRRHQRAAGEAQRRGHRRTRPRRAVACTMLVDRSRLEAGVLEVDEQIVAPGLRAARSHRRA